MAADARGQIVSQLISVVDPSLREIEHIHAHRTEADNVYLTDGTNNVLNGKIEWIEVKNACRSGFRRVAAQRSVQKELTILRVCEPPGDSAGNQKIRVAALVKDKSRAAV